MQRDGLPQIRREVALALAGLHGEQKGLNEAVTALGSGTTDKFVAFGGLGFAGLGVLALLAGGPVTWLVAAGGAGSVGGSGLALVGTVRFRQHTRELERLHQRQRWLSSEIMRYTRALERVSEAIDLRERQLAD